MYRYMFYLNFKMQTTLNIPISFSKVFKPWPNGRNISLQEHVTLLHENLGPVWPPC